MINFNQTKLTQKVKHNSEVGLKTDSNYNQSEIRSLRDNLEEVESFRVQQNPNASDFADFPATIYYMLDVFHDYNTQEEAEVIFRERLKKLYDNYQLNNRK
jgi:hypothetical protein